MGGKQESLPKADEWKIRDKMTQKELGQINKLSNPILKSIFELQNKSDLENSYFK